MRAVRPFAAALTAALLAGCVTLLPKEAPTQLYRFGGALTPAPVQARQPQFGVQPLVLSFSRASASDRILTVTGTQVAYIKGARWVTGAASLFESALANAFDADQGAARLMARGEVVRPDYLLKVDVRTFEARYVHGLGAAPDIVVEVYAVISRPTERTAVDEHMFTAFVPASENRASAIAQAFDQAVNKILTELVKWVDAKGGS